MKPLFVEPGRPWESGHVESFNGGPRDEPLNPEIFDALLEARVLVGRWRRVYNTARPRGARDDRPPAPEARLTRPPESGPADP